MFPTSLPSALRLYAGDDFSVTLRFMEAGVPTDLSGWLDWRADWRSYSKTGAFTVDESRLSEGIITLTLTGEQTRAMSESGSWDLQARRDGITRTWVRASTSWNEDVTRP